MKRALIAALTVFFILLAGCNTTQVASPSPGKAKKEPWGITPAKIKAAHQSMTEDFKLIHESEKMLIYEAYDMIDNPLSEQGTVFARDVIAYKFLDGKYVMVNNEKTYENEKIAQHFREQKIKEFDSVLGKHEVNNEGKQNSMFIWKNHATVIATVKNGLDIQRFDPEKINRKNYTEYSMMHVFQLLSIPR